MKAKSIFAATLLVAGAAFADSTEVTTEYVLGVMPVSVTNETIIAIPWIEPGGASTGVAVTNLIKTATLEVGDLLYWYNPAANDNAGAYYAWEVVKPGDVKYWKAVTDVQKGSVTIQLSADVSALERGQALFLKRANDCVTTNAYVVGQYTNIVSTTTAIAARKDVGVPSYTLLAPPYTDKLGSDTGYIDLNNSAIYWDSPSVNDAIIVGIKQVTLGDTKVGVQDKYVWGSSDGENYVWGRYKGLTFTPGAKVPVGTGLWYVSYRTTAGTVIWGAAQ